MPLDLLQLTRAIVDGLTGPGGEENPQVRDATVFMVIFGIFNANAWAPLDRTYESVNDVLQRTQEAATEESRATLATELVERAITYFSSDVNANVFLGNHLNGRYAAMDAVRDMGTKCVRRILNAYCDRAFWQAPNLGGHLHFVLRQFCGEWYRTLSPMFTEPAKADGFMAVLVDCVKQRLVEVSPQQAQRVAMMEPVLLQLYQKLKAEDLSVPLAV